MDINQNLNNLMKEAQKMQKRMQEAQAQLLQVVVKGVAGGGIVEVEMNGGHYVLNVTINSDKIGSNTEMLQDLVAAAVNDAVSKIEKVSKEKINELASGFNLPTDLPKDQEK